MLRAPGINGAANQQLCCQATQGPHIRDASVWETQHDLWGSEMKER